MILTEIFFIALITLTVFVTSIIVFINMPYLPGIIKQLQIHAKKQKVRVLFVYPHPDDEVMASGSLITKLARMSQKFEVHVISVTKGELGNAKLKVSKEKLKEVRSNEFLRALNKIGEVNAQVEDFGDCKVESKTNEIKNYLRNFIKINQIEIVFTYEKTGLYGHPDHVALSKYVHELSREVKFKVFYSTIPHRIEKLAAIRKQIHGLELHNDELCQKPKFKFFSIYGQWKKYLATKEYKSQNLVYIVPVLLKAFLVPYEYYTDEY